MNCTSSIRTAVTGPGVLGRHDDPMASSFLKRYRFGLDADAGPHLADAEPVVDEVVNSSTLPPFST